MLEVNTRKLGRLLVTGFPGWLIQGYLNRLRQLPPAGLTSIRCFVLHGTQVDTAELRSSLGVDVDVVYGDLRDPVSIAAAVRGVDSVFHAAGILHVARTKEWYDVNTEGTRVLANAAAEAGVERFLFISSNAAAGRASAPDRLMVESDPPRPLSHYGRSKWLAEQSVNALSNRMQTVILRPCMFYGPPVPARHIDIYRRIQTGRMPLIGHGNYARSVSYIDNLVQGCDLALTHPAAAGQTYYIADRQVYTTRQVVEAMATALQVPVRWLRFPAIMAPTAFILDRILAALGIYWQTLHLVGEADWHVGVSCEKAARELGYAPAVDLAEGMAQAVLWCKETGQLTGPKSS